MAANLNHGDTDVALDAVGKTYPGERGRPPHAALKGVDLHVAKGEVVALIGPSGCGKSTTLRLVAGLDDPDEGEVRIAGRPMRDVAPQDRDVAMVFQGYALYPHMTAREIMEFPLRMRGVAKAERTRAVEEAAGRLGLSRLLDRRPDQLSGGERQRVAMGRALVRKPRVFLFDEPLSNIDPALREEIRGELAVIVRDLGATVLYVTHDHIEAMTLADRVAVLHCGRLLQVSSPREVYERPAAEFVATFVGSPRMNVIAGEVRAGELRAGPFRLAKPAGVSPSSVRVGVRAEHVRVGEGDVEVTVTAVEPHGAETLVTLSVGEITLRARRPGFASHRPGETVKVALDEGALHLFDPSRDGARVETV